MKKLIFLLLLVNSQIVFSQENSERILSAPAFMQIVNAYHPVVKQADIQIDKSKAGIQLARGLFDPLLETHLAQKTFDGVRYYRTIEPAISIPTWYGVELSAGLASFNGDRINPSETRGKTSFIGLSVPLAKNLLMDKRRAALKTAKIYRELSDVEKKTVVNDLILDAMIAYWQWVKAYHLYIIVSDAVIVNEKRLVFVKTAYQLGERPAIDTTETLAQLQSFLYLQSENLLQLENAALELSVFLWQNNGQPVLMSREVVPEQNLVAAEVSTRPLPLLDGILLTAQQNHPKIREFDFKLKALDINRQLKFQELLPSINLKYNQLAKGYDILKTVGVPLGDNNFQYGLSLSFPLRFLEGRGAYKIAKLKIDETVLEQNLAKVNITNKIKTALNKLATLQNQIIIQFGAYSNYMILQRGEETRFFNGESSLFLINTRETKALEALQKLIELKAKYFETEVLVQWASGVLG